MRWLFVALAVVGQMADLSEAKSQEIASESEVVAKIAFIEQSVDLDQDLIDKLNQAAVSSDLYDVPDAQQIDYRKWHVFMGENRGVLVSRNTIDINEGRHIRIRKSICRSHLPPWSICDFKVPDAIGLSLSGPRDPVLPKGEAVVLRPGFRVVLFFPVNGPPGHVTYRYGFLFSKGEVVN